MSQGEPRTAMWHQIVVSSIVILSMFYLPCAGQPTSCLNGFFESQSLPDGGRNQLLQQSVIPGINFTCNGSITGWRIGARWVRGGDFFPYLQIWRSTGGDSYTLEEGTELFVSDNGRNNGDYLFDGIPDPPVEFQVGDVLGIFQPRRSRVNLNFQSNTGPTNYMMRTENTASPSLDSFTITDRTVRANTHWPIISVQFRINCPSLDDPIGGSVEVTTDDNGTMSSAYTCDQGYRLIGNTVRTCQDNGTWNGTEPTCTSINTSAASTRDGSSGTYTIIGSVVGVVLLSSVIVLLVCIKKKRVRNGDTQERGNLDNIHIQDNQAYMLNSHSTGPNAAYGVVNEENNGGYIINNTWKSREDDSIKDGGSCPLYEDITSLSNLTEHPSMSPYDYAVVNTRHI